MRAIAFLALIVGAQSAIAQDLQLPGNAVQTVASVSPDDGLVLATGPWADGALLGITVEGTVDQSIWRINATGLTTQQLMAPLKDQLLQSGYEIIFACDTDACGGFDFRFAIDVAPPPAMQIDLGDFRYLSARKDTQFATILVSRTARSGYLQITTVAPPSEDVATIVANGNGIRSSAADPVTSATNLNVQQALDTTGRAILTGLAFETGAANLANQPYLSLQELAGFLRSNPNLTVALVGHTDASGPLEANISLSKRRAAAVLERLVTAHGIPRAQLAAEGMGYLSPIADNRTAEGRNANRRVEVIITSTQ